MTRTFSDTHGFPRADVTLATWRTAPYNVWAFQNLRDLVPTAEITCAKVEPEEAIAADSIADAAIDPGIDGISKVSDFLRYAHTDGLVVMRDGKIVGEYYAPHADVNRPHVIFSVSKSLTALISGILEGQGVIDPDKPVTAYIPEAAGSAYGDATYRDVLDMRVSLDFEEAYLDPNGAFARYRRATLWNPRDPGLPSETLPDFLLSLKKAGRPHGGKFAYLSPNSDMLGMLLERITGVRFADLMSELLWKPLGAKNNGYVTVDAVGSPRTAGGINITTRDLARVGELLRQGGAIGGKQIVKPAWIADMTQNGDRQAWIDGGSELLANGRYRSKWYQTGEADGSYCGIGIHGQWLWVDPSTDTVIATVSSQPIPINDAMEKDTISFFRAIGRLAL
ncbi:serine hydrolase [Rhizobium sp. LjRoot30]|uniref:serine hydrolase domain-containing protein n=1 Tax=Rhizobium sp. LjRoot30 TaxID=3342320 RepID=UPI003ECE6F6A